MQNTGFCLVVLLFLVLFCEGTVVFQKRNDVRRSLIGKLTFKHQKAMNIQYPFQNVSLPWNERVDDLVKQFSALWNHETKQFRSL